MKLRVYLADLTHIGMGMASEIFPLNIGLIAAYTNKVFGNEVEVTLFKHPLKLLSALRNSPPKILGLSNYTWNYNLSYYFTKMAKELNSEVLTVWGGTNYPFVSSKQDELLRQLPYLDAHIYYEAEETFVKIVERILSRQNLRMVFDSPIDGCQFISPEDGSFVSGSERPRIKNLDSIPSPYTTGILDQFFEDSLIPMVEHSRGCPFACDFCNAGADYFNAVNKFSNEYVEEELTYIAKKCKKHGGKFLHIADNNFAMIPRDIETCKLISDLRQEYGWPLSIGVNTGKNSKERIMQATKLLGDKFSVSLSVQSMNDSVLKNIKRDNISLDDMRAIAAENIEMGRKNYAEVITVLPGETYKTQIAGINELLDIGVTTILANSFTPLAGTPYKDDNEIVETNQYLTKFRIVVRNFSEFDGERIFDVEEVAVASKDMSFEEYVKVRVYMFIIELCRNSGVFTLLFRYISLFEINASEWIHSIHDNLEKISNSPFKEVIKSFELESQDELWDTKEELIEHFSKSENYKLLLDGERGGNVIYRHRIWMFAQFSEQFVEYVFQTTEMLIGVQKVGSTLESIQKELAAIKKYILGTVNNCNKSTDWNKVVTEKLYYDIPKWATSASSSQLKNFKSEEPLMFKFYLDQKDIDLLQDAHSRFGSSTTGMTKLLQRTLGRMPTRKVDECAIK